IVFFVLVMAWLKKCVLLVLRGENCPVVKDIFIRGSEMRALRNLMLAIMLLLGTSLAHALPTYTLEISNVDDNFYAYLSNSSYSSLQVAYVSCCGPDTAQTFDISALVTLGANSLEFQDYNNQGGGWTYAWNLREDGISIASDSCGTFG